MNSFCCYCSLVYFTVVQIDSNQAVDLSSRSWIILDEYIPLTENFGFHRSNTAGFRASALFFLWPLCQLSPSNPSEVPCSSSKHLLIVQFQGIWNMILRVHFLNDRLVGLSDLDPKDRVLVLPYFDHWVYCSHCSRENHRSCSLFLFPTPPV